MHLHLFGPLADQVDDFSDEIWTNAEALQNFLVFFQNIFRYEPDEIVPLAPPVEYIGTRIPAGNNGSLRPDMPATSTLVSTTARGLRFLAFCSNGDLWRTSLFTIAAYRAQDFFFGYLPDVSCGLG